MITEEAFLFDIPDNWKWVKLGDCCTYAFSGKSPKYTKTPNDNITIGQRNNQNYGIDFTHLKYCTNDFMEKYNQDMFLQEYDILLNTLGGGTVGRTGLYHNPYGFKCITDGHLFVFRTGIITFQKYLYYVLKAYQRKIEKDAEGSTNQSFLKLGNVKAYLIPVPPLEEQKRIVAKIEELIPYVEKYDKAYSEVEKLNKKFPEDMQKSILQYAVQGKLVEQRKEEGNVEDLYKQIQEEKKKLIKEGKIKKQKVLPKITEDEIPFDIPENWKWVRLGKVAMKITDGSHNPPPKKSSGYYVISAKNVKNGKIVFDNVERYTDEEGFQKENSRTNIQRGDIIMGIIGGSIGNIATYDHDEKVIAQRSISIIDTLVSNDYIKTVLQSPFIQYQLKNTSSTAQGGVYLGTINELLIPLPPLEEQKRIVEGLDKVLPYTQQLVE